LITANSFDEFQNIMTPGTHFFSWHSICRCHQHPFAGLLNICHETLIVQLAFPLSVDYNFFHNSRNEF
jgi:hypothetical protein